MAYIHLKHIDRIKLLILETFAIESLGMQIVYVFELLMLVISEFEEIQKLKRSKKQGGVTVELGRLDLWTDLELSVTAVQVLESFRGTYVHCGRREALSSFHRLLSEEVLYDFLKICKFVDAYPDFTKSYM